MTSLKPTFIKCSVLSLRDSCIFYPSCVNCISRLEREPTDRRYKCRKCGLTCEVGSASYTYRLALAVRADGRVLPLTVFGSCLNPHFGLSALGLHRLVEESKRAEGSRADRVQQLLLKAVENCFIGRCFVFGVKMPGINLDGSRCCSSSFPAFLSTGGISRQFIASRIILPDSAVKSSPVVLYFRKLLNAGNPTDHGVSQEPWESVAVPELEDSMSSSDSECTLASHGGSLLRRSNGNISTGGLYQQSPGLIMSPAEEENVYTTAEGDPQWHKKGKRSKRFFSHGTPSRFCSSEIKRKRKNKDQIDESCLASSACYESRDESVENVVISDIQNKNFSPHSSLDLSLSTGPMNHNIHDTMKNGKIIQKHAHQFEDFDLKMEDVREMGVCLREKDALDIQPSVSGRANSSLVWEDLACSEGVSEIFHNENSICEAVAKSKMCNPVMSVISENESCVFDMRRNAQSCHEKLSNSNENVHDSVEGEEAVSDGDGSTYSSVPSIDHNKIEETSVAEVKSFCKLSHMFQVLKRREGDVSLSVPGSPVLKTLTEQLSLIEEQNSQTCSAALHNVSADLFSSFEESSSAGAEINKDMIKASTESEDISQSFNACRPLNLNSNGNHAWNTNVKSKCGSCVSETGKLNSLEFVPFSQSTPNAKAPAALEHFQHRRTNQSHFQGDGLFTKQHLKWHHCCCDAEVDDRRLRIADGDSEDLGCVQVKRICECLLLKNHSSCQKLISRTGAEHNSLVFDLSEDLFCSFNLM